MKFVLAFNGSRGDVQPAIALGCELAGRGHDIVLAVPPNLTEFAAAAGLRVHGYGLDTGELLRSEVVSRDLRSANPVTRLHAVSEITLRGGRTMQQDLLDLTTDADAIIGGSAGQERAFNVALVRGIPYIPVHLCPIRRNGEVSLLTQFGIDRPRALARISWTILEQILWRATRSAEKTLAAEVGLTAVDAPVATRIGRQGVPEIQAYDAALFPGLAVEWGKRRPLVGFFDLAPQTRELMADGHSEDRLMDWLDAGPPPLYVGFGSMTVADPDGLVRAIASATEVLGLRVLLATGWGGLTYDGPDDRVLAVPTVDHHAVLPRCVGAVHHGGAGSTAASLRAGLPTLIYWLGADQPMWGRQIRRRGAGLGFPLAGIDARGFGSALETLLTPDHTRRAQALSEQLVTASAAVTAAATLVEHAVRPR
ncbi:UDP:flavonoid glycosyltransferase YjiC (YdhE family) [Williamsia limnetica]|uniref:UDP:flavonoid glycosyltransferase YjiC (YdhE family) n=1 Tax=Williamsia limnetica TaxID=882452 RepID=A0A318RE79_WILLI|nr:glycosyltransferase [Williamsia limnetica]PYE14735.1 UDP:flavonoid glycosyltransferase YjiC (YdhE family) [Williamsia limnetica]